MVCATINRVRKPTNIFMMPGDVLLMGRGASVPQGSFILYARCWGSSKCAACKQHENCCASACCSRDTGHSNLHFLEKALHSGQVCSLPSPTTTTAKKLLRLSSLLHIHAFSYCSTRNRERFLFCIFIFALESLQNIPWWVFFLLLWMKVLWHIVLKEMKTEYRYRAAEQYCGLPGAGKHSESCLFLRRGRMAFCSSFPLREG